jgi:hypothetical protein
MSFAKLKIETSRNASFAVALALLAAGCTQSVPSQFKLLRAEDSAPAAFEVGEVVVEKHGAPVDILWVVDNSASMLTSQTKLKNGLAAFARDYLTKDGTDIQLAVITTDTYVANNAWEKYLNTENPETKKTPLQVHASKEPNQRQWGPDYAKISASALMSTKSKSGLVSNFQSRVLVGTQGIYEEHGFDSVAQFIADNEKGSSANKLFRKGSQRIIIFLSDEDDQSMGDNVGPEPRKLLYSGSYYTGVNAAAADKILPPQFTINCPGEPNVLGKPITAATAMTLCARPGTVEGVNVFKDQLDSFFRGLDGNPVGSPNYFITAIVGQDPKTIETLRRNTTEKNAETKLTVITNEIGTRYIDLVNEAGNGSFAMDIGASDYSPILKKIGLEIEKRSVVKKTSPQTTFILDRAPDTREKLVVTVQTAGGRVFVLADSQYHVAANKLVITDKSLISVLQPGDRISVQYQPATVLPASK